MALTVTQRPSTLISGNTSRWNAANNPIVYKMTREDYQISAVANSAGALQITVNTNLTTLTTAQGGPVVVGATMWVTTDNGVYNGLYTVVTVTSAANSVVTFGASTYTSAATTGHINLTQRTNYRVSVQVLNAANLVLNTLTYSPDRAGSLVIDVSNPLLNSLSADNVADYVTGFTTNDETTAYVKFYIKYQELWTNSAEAVVDDVANQFFALYGARQIGELYGGNLAEYVNYENGTPLALFLTKFTRPVIWRGYPFSITTITSDNVSTNSNFRIEYFDVAGASISTNAVTKAANAGRLFRLSPNNALAIPANAVTMSVRYEKTGIVVLSQTLTLDIKDPCANPVMLWWRNSIGGDAFWMFDVNQQHSYKYANGKKVKRMILYADNLTLNQYDAINELNTMGELYEPAIPELTTSVNKTAARVGAQVYIMHATGKKTGVIVVPNEFATLTRNKRHKLQITIELPEIF